MAALGVESFRDHLNVAVVVVVLILANLIAHFITPWPGGMVTVPAVAVGLAASMRWCNGLGWADLALGRADWKTGSGYALAAVIAVMSIIAAGLLLPWTRPLF